MAICHKKLFKKSMNTHVFEFKISQPLKHYGIDYDPGQYNHKVKIVFLRQKRIPLKLRKSLEWCSSVVYKVSWHIFSQAEHSFLTCMYS